MITSNYKAQVDLLLQVLPFVAKETVFALKGGTAINLFIRDMPRLSVDIDLTYLNFDARNDALSNIEKSLKRIKSDIEKNIPSIKVHTVSLNGGTDVKLNCQAKNAQIKIEVNTITRGHIYSTKLMQVVDSVQDEFGKFAAINVISMAELYGGKICAAIDRQHPRDIFDVKLLFENEGFTNEIWNAFIVGLISHYKPIGELLNPVLKNQKSAFENQFKGMSKIPFTYSEYEETRAELIELINSKLSNNNRDFLISFEQGKPNWSLFPIKVAKDLSAVKWKLLNIKKLKTNNPNKHELMVNSLKKFLKYS